MTLVSELIQEDCACAASLDEVTGQVVLTLFSVTSPMTPEITSDFEAALDTLTENSPSDFANTTYSNWTPACKNMVMTACEARRRHLRHLQEEDNSTLFPLLTRTVMTADVEANSFETPIDQLLRDTMNVNTTGFTGILKASANDYFATVESAEAEYAAGPTPVPEPLATAAPTTLATVAPAPAPSTGGNGGGLSPAAIVGIVVAIVVAIVIAVVTMIRGLVHWRLSRGSGR
jgi:hypothetical protein